MKIETTSHGAGSHGASVKILIALALAVGSSELAAQPGFEITGVVPLHLDLGGTASVMRSLEGPFRPLHRSEHVDGKDYFENEFLIAELDPSTGTYAAVVSTDEAFAAEGTRALNQATSPGLGPERVFLLKSAEHPRTETWMPPPHVTFADAFPSGRVRMRRPDRPTRDEGDHALETTIERPWRFLARFDVRESGTRQTDVLWTEGEVEGVWLSTLQNSIELSGEGRHRVLVYALVEVGATIRVRERLAVLPRCCCGTQICV